MTSRFLSSARGARFGRWILAGLALAMVWNFGRWLFGIDPFARYRADAVGADEQEGISMDDVEFAIYDGQKLVGTCDVEHMGVGRDRSRVRLTGVRNGRMTTPEGSFRFEAPYAEFEKRTNVLLAPRTARIWNQDFDLRPASFAYFQRVNKIQTYGAVTGTFFGGAIEAQDLMYRPDTGEAYAGPISWRGSLPESLRETPGLQDSAAKPWDIRGGTMSVKGDVWVFRNGRATDGDIIVVADIVEHNKKSDVVSATGNVRYYSAKANLVCERATIYRKEKRAILAGNVTMLVKPKEQEKLEEITIPPFRPIVPDSIAAGRPAPPVLQEERQRNEELRQNNLRKYPTQIWAEKIEYWYRRGARRATITGTPQARQDLPGGRWRHLWTNTAQFDVEADQLKLLSSEAKKDTRLKTSLGDDLVAKWLQVSTREGGEDEMSGEDVEGTVVSDDEDVNRGTTTGGGQAPKPPLRGGIGARA